MTQTPQVEELFTQHTSRLDAHLQTFFEEKPELEMYKHLGYFMGFADEALQPALLSVGKRFRPSLTLMLGEWYGVREAVFDAALSIELFHNFTLIHDDIVDKDEMRRGRPTVWKLFGTDHAINSGDGQLLLSLEVIMTSTILTPEQKVTAYTFLSAQYRRVIEGQYLDFTLATLPLTDTRVTTEMYFDMIGRKTADLVAAATKIVGIVVSASESETEHLFLYGYHLGVTYQLIDDMISIWGSETDSGKRMQGDLYERKKTLPILMLYQKADDEVRRRLVSLYSKSEEMTSDDTAEILKYLKEYDVHTDITSVVTERIQKSWDAAAQLSLTKEQYKILHDITAVLLNDIKRVD